MMFLDAIYLIKKNKTQLISDLNQDVQIVIIIYRLFTYDA